MDGQVTFPVVADTDEEIEAVAIPLDAYPSDVSPVDEGKHRTPYDRSSRMSDLARERPTRGGWFDELDVQIPEPFQGSQIILHPSKRARDGLEQVTSTFVGVHPELNQGGCSCIDCKGASTAIIQPPRSKNGQNGLQRDGVAIRLFSQPFGQVGYFIAVWAHDDPMDVLDAGVGYSLTRISRELDTVVERIVRDDPMALASVAELVDGSRRIFVLGAGRSGLALRMTAMRLMHLGRDVHVVGEVTSPAIGEGDLLLTASGSGTTAGIVRAAKTAVDAGARVAAVTTAPESPLGQLATASIVVPAAAKLDRSEAASAQYAGSLFEQSVVLIGDALFHALWQRSGQSADDLWPRHANME